MGKFSNIFRSSVVFWSIFFVSPCEASFCHRALAFLGLDRDARAYVLQASRKSTKLNQLDLILSPLGQSVLIKRESKAPEMKILKERIESAVLTDIPVNTIRSKILIRHIAKQLLTLKLLFDLSFPEAEISWADVSSSLDQILKELGFENIDSRSVFRPDHLETLDITMVPWSFRFEIESQSLNPTTASFDYLLSKLAELSERRIQSAPIGYVWALTGGFVRIADRCYFNLFGCRAITIDRFERRGDRQGLYFEAHFRLNSWKKRKVALSIDRQFRDLDQLFGLDCVASVHAGTCGSFAPTFFWRNGILVLTPLIGAPLPSLLMLTLQKKVLSRSIEYLEWGRPDKKAIFLVLFWLSWHDGGILFVELQIWWKLFHNLF